jgi:DNA-binding IclR family transcriptional regulator
LSDEERKERVKRQIERQKQKMAQMTPEELEAFKEKMREIGRQRYAKKKEGKKMCIQHGGPK